MEEFKFLNSDEEYKFQPKRKRTKEAIISRNDVDISEGETCDELDSSEDEKNNGSDEDSGDNASIKCSSEEEGTEDENSELGDDSEVDIKNAIDDKDEENIIQFGKDQERVFTYVKNLLEDKKFRKENPKIIIINGAAGTGKTELLNGICKYARSKLDCQVVCTASTGVAALKYYEGRTAHSMFGFPFNVNSLAKYCEINDYDQQVSGASLIIYDAANMTDNRLIEMLNASLKKLMLSDQMFGGKIIIFAADFLELGPIVPNILNNALLHTFSIKYCSLFNLDNTKYFSLNTAYRTKKDEEYVDYLIDLGFGNFPPVFHQGMHCVPLTDIKFSTHIKEVIDYIYPPHILSDPDLCAKRAILTTTKKETQKINALIIEKRRKSTTIKKSIDFFDIGDWVENLEALDETNENKVFPDAYLELWKGCVCMVIQNMYQPSTLLNGSKVIVQDIQPDVIYVRRPGEKWTLPIERKTFGVPGMGKSFTRKQFPLKVAYATTIHRSQGQTLDKVGVDLREPVFRHGQLYLALSRVKHSKDVMVCIKKQHIIKGVPYAVNVVDNHLIRPTLI
ncbi:hypothetical protein O0L34_g1585 [Tuta absoluta]|nr:hypothetical protein O0L34_g1585 [Tuta absoluta]